MPLPFADPEFWVLVAVVIAVAAVFGRAKRAILGLLDDRAERIRQQLDEARALRDEAQQALAAYRQRERDAAAEAQQIIAHAEAEAALIASQATRNLDEALARQQILAEERIAQAEAKAIADIRMVTVDIAIAAAHQVIAESLDQRRGAELLDDAIAALPHQLH
jgi:F-type H+-transporting ATPase subunit b